SITVNVLLNLITSSPTETRKPRIIDDHHFRSVPPGRWLHDFSDGCHDRLIYVVPCCIYKLREPLLRPMYFWGHEESMIPPICPRGQGKHYWSVHCGSCGD